MNMRKIALRLLSASYLLFILVAVTSCNNDDETDLVGNWVDCKFSFEGRGRSNAVSFVIDSKAYIVGGYDGEEREYLKDAWSFNPENKQWTLIDSLPKACIGRINAVGFSINGKGYYGLGFDGDNKLNDFWEYDPSTNKWTQLNDFTGTARYGSTAFSIGDKGYIVGGYDGTHLKDLWEYDPTSDSWTKKSSIPGNKRKFASVFIIDEKAYVFGGINNGTIVEDFYCYDPSTDTWEEKRDVANNSDDSYDDDYVSIARENAATFVINGLGYVATGEIVSGLISKVWEYDPSTDLWKEKTGFEGSSRICGVGLTLNDKGYVLLGKSSSYYYDDIWEFEPFATYDDQD